MYVLLKRKISYKSKKIYIPNVYKYLNVCEKRSLKSEKFKKYLNTFIIYYEKEIKDCCKIVRFYAYKFIIFYLYT